MKQREYVVRSDVVPRVAQVTDRGVFVKSLLTEKIGTKNLYFAMGILEPGASAPTSGFVKHDVEEGEFCLNGHGQAAFRDKTYRIEPGMAFYIPAGVAHRFMNTADEPLIMLYAYPAIKAERTVVE